MNAMQDDQISDEIRSEIKKEGENLGRFLDLVESFRAIIPDEGKRYYAAFTALSKTMGLDRDMITEAADKQLEALKKQEDGLSQKVKEKRDELDSLTSKAKSLRKEITVLQESIGRLEKEEKDIVDNISSEENKIKLMEEGFDNVVKEIKDGIIAVRGKVVDYLSEENLKKEAAASDAASGLPEADATPEPVALEKPEEVSAPSGPGDDAKTEETDAASSLPEADATPEPVALEKPEEVFVPSGPSDDDQAGASTLTDPFAENTEKKKEHPCPICNSGMDWYSMEKKWKCYTCGHEE
jgi:hypothetical protein